MGSAYGTAYCDTCNCKLAKQTRGRPSKFCSKECRVLNDAIERLERALGPVTDRLLNGTEESPATHKDHLNLVDLRYRLFTLVSTEMPRPRYPKGHARAGQFIRRTVG